MKVENKLEIFKKNALAEADKTAAFYLHELDEQLAELEQTIADKARLDAKETMSIATRKAQAGNNRELLIATRNAKLNILALRNSLTDELFDEVRQMLARYADSAEYAEDLYTRVKEAVLAYNNAPISLRLRPEDRVYIMKRLAADNASGNITAVEDSGIIGGFAVYAKDKGVALDMTFARLLEDERAEFGGFKGV